MNSSAFDDTMGRPRSVRIATSFGCALLLLLSPQTANAQNSRASSEPTEAPRVEIWLLSGGAAFTAFRNQEVRAIPDAEDPRSFERAITAASTISLTLMGAYRISEAWRLRAGFSFAPSYFTIRMEERDREFLEAAGYPSVVARYADLDIWLTEASALRRIGVGISAVQPYALAGIGAIRYQDRGSAEDSVPGGVRGSLAPGDGTTRLAAVVGAGAEIRLQRTLGLHFELSNHVTTQFLRTAEPDVADFDGVVLLTDPTGSDAELGGDVRFVNHLRFMAGVSFGLGAWDSAGQ